MSDPLDFPDAAPVTLEEALVAVAGWRAAGTPLYGLHQVAIALANEVERQRGRIENLDADAANDAALLAGMQAALAGMRAALADAQRTFDLRWDADMRAVKRWRAEHPERDLIFPDRADLVVWLLERFHVEQQDSGSSVIDDASPRGATVPGEGA